MGEEGQGVFAVNFRFVLRWPTKIIQHISVIKGLGTWLDCVQMHHSHSLLLCLAGSCGIVGTVGVLADDVRILEHGIVNGGKCVVLGHSAGRRVST